MNIPKDIKSLKSKCFISTTPHSMYNKMKVKPPCNTIVLLNRFYHVLYSTTIHNIPKVFPAFHFSSTFLQKNFTKSSYEIKNMNSQKEHGNNRNSFMKCQYHRKLVQYHTKYFLLQMQLQELSSNTRLFCSSFCHKPIHEVC